MTLLKRSVLFVSVLGLTFPVLADRAVFEQQCAGCHMPDASGNPALNAPNLTGLTQGYLSRQINNYRTGVRGSDPRDSGGAMMVAVVTALSDEQVLSVSSFIAALPTVRAPAMPGRGGLAGRGLYSGCKSCHGSGGEGNESLKAPRLAGQHADYLALQLANFRNGIRGTDPKDRYGYQMAAIARALPGEEAIDSLVEYISHLGE